MHPEVKQEKQGKCSKCGMKLVLKSTLDKQKTETKEKQTYTPLLIIFGLLFLTAIVISYSTGFSINKLISLFMIGFFLVFSGFKLIDLPGFAQGYETYDILAQKISVYGYIYPFIELFFALAMILNFQIRTVLIIEIIVMVFSGVGVIIKLGRHERFQCACLGTFLKVPLTKVTVIEDFGMALLAIILLVLR